LPALPVRSEPLLHRRPDPAARADGRAGAAPAGRDGADGRPRRTGDAPPGGLEPVGPRPGPGDGAAHRRRRPPGAAPPGPDTARVRAAAPSRGHRDLPRAAGLAVTPGALRGPRP